MIEIPQAISPMEDGVADHYDRLSAQFGVDSLPALTFRYDAPRRVDEYYSHDFVIHTQTEAQKVGNISFMPNESLPEIAIYWMHIDSDCRYKGFGPAAYLLAAAFAHTNGRDLRSNGFETSEHAVVRWEKFVGKNLAIAEAPPEYLFMTDEGVAIFAANYVIPSPSHTLPDQSDR